MADVVCFNRAVTIQNIASLIDIDIEQGDNQKDLENACDIYCTNLYKRWSVTVCDIESLL